MAAALHAKGAHAQDESLVGETVVTGTRSERRLADSPVATEVITRADLEASGAESVAGALEEHPGLDVNRANASGANVRIQGLDPQYVLILVDGERLAGRVNGAIDLTRIPLDDVQRIEIVRGPSSALYGADALGGVINLITRRAARPLELEAHARGGTLGTLDAHGRAALQRGPLNLSLTAGHHRRDAFDLAPETPATDGGAFVTTDASTRAAWRVNERLSLVGTAAWLRRDQRAIDDGPGGAVYDRRNLTETASASLTPTLRLGDDAQLRLGLWFSQYRDQFLRDQRGSDALDQYQQTVDRVANASLQLDASPHARHRVTVGLEGFFEQLDADRLRNGTGRRVRAALYAQDQWTLLDGAVPVTLVPGVRLDVDSQFGAAPTPKLQLRLDPRPGLALRVSYGWGFRAPSFQELLLLFENPSAGYLVEGNTALRSETSRAVNASVEWRASRTLWLSTNLYRNDIDDLIDTVVVAPSAPGESTRYRYQNVARAWTMGAELSARLRPVEGVVIDLGYTLTATRDLANQRPLEGRALHRGTVGVQLRHAHTGLELTTRAAFVGARPFYSVPGVSEAPPYASVDARAAWTWQRTLTLFVGCDNALDAGDAQVLRLPPRTFYAGLTLRR